MASEEAKDRLLADDDSFYDEAGAEYLKHKNGRRPYRKLVSWVLYIVLAVSLVINVSYATGYLQKRRPSEASETQMHADEPVERSAYSQLPHNVPTTYRRHTEWIGDNTTRADELWETLNLDYPLVIAPSQRWVQQKGLPKSWPFPWDTNKEYYFVKVFHQLHCLKLMRRYVVDIDRNRTQTVTEEHMYHCLDLLRQDLMCKADDTPLNALEARDAVGEGQTMQCVDWEKFVDWARAPERNACYRRVNDYRQVEHGIERFAFCPENSEYRPIMEEYFDIHGHKPLFSDSDEVGRW